MTRQLFGIDGLACAGCARGLEKRLQSLPGVRAAGVHYLTASALVDWDENQASRADLSAAVAKAGYVMAPRHRPDEVSAAMGRDLHRLGIRLAVAVFAGMWSMVPALVIYFTALGPDVAFWLAVASGLFALPVVFWAGSGILWMAWRSVLLRAPGMDLLIGLGALSACAVSAWSLAQGRSEVWFDTATMLITLLLFGRLVDTATRRSAVDALRAMEDASPETALVETDAGWQPQPCADVAIGRRIAVDAGAPVSMDGVVLSGDSQINRAVLTGETALVAVGSGDRVEAGAINLGRRLILRVERAFGDREIDRMGGAIALEVARRGTRASASDHWAARLSVAIPALAAITALVSFGLGLGAEAALLRGLTLLVAACPCALAIALPLAQMRAAQTAAAQGMRLRDPDAFGALGHLGSIVFDKTGTLTTGQLQVVELRPAEGIDAAQLLQLAALAETGISHPIARAIIAAHGCEAGVGGRRLPRGAEAEDDAGRVVEIGAAGQADAQGRSWLVVRRDGREVGRIALADTLRPEAASVLATLREQGIVLHMATGDSAPAALALADRLGLSAGSVSHDCTPSQKAALLGSLPRPVAFVGDGVNDGPALAAADCGISVADAHSAAVQTAAVVITAGGLTHIAGAITLSRGTRRIAHQNLALALIYNAFMLPAAAFGLIGPAVAAAAMLASSVSVILNSQRLGRRAAGEDRPAAPRAGWISAGVADKFETL
ncbi:cation-transporting P-type ATPase [Paracoccus suum]|uniref:Cation-transporting P-type ATPase n=1 Tax=Paracoccus suum TaxID=2259340 RepID=A0A344PJJ3_9RHOB|nr:cation-translocating P-type ATPase [Paracoccus suum]AXC49548.1 cation-transporting P-type ATPase [Paracoccus suum]